MTYERPMNRTDFERLRDLPEKIIRCDIRFVPRRQVAPLLVADDVRIENGAGVDARLTMTYNPKVGSKSLNVHVPGIGPICRLDVDGPPHRPAGRSHKHSLQTERCPGRNLPDRVIDRPDVSGLEFRYLFHEFCKLAQITHDGTFYPPEESR